MEPLERRVEQLEHKLDNGRYLRRETFDLVSIELRGDIADLRKAIANDKAERRSLRNLMLAAFIAAALSIAASVITYNLLA